MSASITSVLFAPTIALRSRAESRLATNPIRHPASATATDNGNHVPPVGSATTKLPAKGPNRSDNALIPAKVGGTRKSWSTPTRGSLPDRQPLPHVDPDRHPWGVTATTVKHSHRGHSLDRTGRPRSATPANLGDLEQPRTDNTQEG